MEDEGNVQVAGPHAAVYAVGAVAVVKPLVAGAWTFCRTRICEDATHAFIAICENATHAFTTKTKRLHNSHRTRPWMCIETDTHTHIHDHKCA